jgi:hypothetical protein
LKIKTWLLAIAGGAGFMASIVVLSVVQTQQRRPRPIPEWWPVHRRWSATISTLFSQRSLPPDVQSWRSPTARMTPSFVASRPGEIIEIMMSMRIVLVSAAMLTFTAFAVPAFAESAIGIASRNSWGLMDKCVKTAHEKYPDETADSLAKRDAYAHTCERNSRAPVRAVRSQKQ